MTNEQTRKAVSDAYDGKGWKNKVIDMTDAQVIAVYISLKKQGRIK